MYCTLLTLCELARYELITVRVVCKTYWPNKLYMGITAVYR